MWVFIHTDIHGNCPYPYPLEFFEVVDSSIPASWEVSFVDRGDGCEFNRISFAEWAADDDFYERLVDEDVKCAETYLAKMRE
ncbi:MAG: hypothetical protein DWQ31_03290 [Planctomycetota bacterium]|nr:MAG: hypothetical protein DWQ31_03290 [Planctomycetota bacterium]REJ90022.1 MAG: hypothetical protein DWQ35_17570 [Planctomycetota bacterium]REK22407.1 MAG: hypothetical protein DWQ42_17205 [Planctomycetota bacterium]REK39733.1 MAG: hypothetical protein DWQ46_17605 [Planctomycetota bacterium]